MLFVLVLEQVHFNSHAPMTTIKFSITVQVIVWHCCIQNRESNFLLKGLNVTFLFSMEWVAVLIPPFRIQWAPSNDKMRMY